jgi:quinol monooxygenase YgiN
MSTNRFSIEQQLIRIELNQILDASRLMEGTIRKHLNEIDAQRVRMEEQWSDEDRAAYEDKLAYDVFDIRDVFAQVLRRSLFISAYAYLEQGLDIICTRLQQERGYTISLADINSRGITRAKTYLSKVVEIIFPRPRSDVDACKSIRRSAELFDSQRAWT